jgi:NAD+-dependent protein deacetylase sirtuin 6
VKDFGIIKFDMSAGYAARLKDYPNKGVCGLIELSETPRAYQVKIRQLTALIRASKHTVVLTGAGISTAAGIPDFRGPKGIWTLEQQHQKNKKQKDKQRQQSVPKRQRLDQSETENAATVTQDAENGDRNAIVDSSAPSSPPATMDFATAQPTLTHRQLYRLVRDGHVQFVVTQNVDGLHRRSGLERQKHAILHGCAFTEKCDRCGTEHFRDYDIGGMSFQKTGRKCQVCPNGDLCDTLLDWEDPLPVDDLERSERHCDQADLAICLGTSLRIQPASELPLRAKQLVIVNLQTTPKDKHATLIIRERVDKVMLDLLEQLGYETIYAETNPSPIQRLWKAESAPF